MRAILFIALLSSTSLFGQLATFEWDDECCHVVGTFDSTKVSRVQLQDALDLFGIYNYTRIDNTPLLFKPYSLEEHQSQGDAFVLNLVRLSKRMVTCTLPEGDCMGSRLAGEFAELQSNLFLYLWNTRHSWKRIIPSCDYCPGTTKTPCWKNMLRHLLEPMRFSWPCLKNTPSAWRPKMATPQRIFDQAKDLLKEENWRELASVNMLTYGWHNEANHGIKRHDEYDTFFNLFLPLFENLDYTDCCEL